VTEKKKDPHLWTRLRSQYCNTEASARVRTNGVGGCRLQQSGWRSTGGDGGGTGHWKGGCLHLGMGSAENSGLNLDAVRTFPAAVVTQGKGHGATVPTDNTWSSGVTAGTGAGTRGSHTRKTEKHEFPG
jgi:hypothetical protein